MRRGQTRQDRVRLRQGVGGDRQAVAACETPLDFSGRDTMPFVPAAHGGDQATGIECADGRHLPSAPNRSARSFDRCGSEGRDPAARHCYRQASPLHELYRQRLWLDLDHAVAPAHVERCVRLEASLAPDLPRDDESPGRIHGSHHAIDSTIRRRSGQGLRAGFTAARRPDIPSTLSCSTWCRIGYRSRCRRVRSGSRLGGS